MYLVSDDPMGNPSVTTITSQSEEDGLTDPLSAAVTVTPGFNNTTFYVFKASGPLVPCIIQNKALSALIDMGLAITAIRAFALTNLTTVINKSQFITFNTAAGVSAHSHGTTTFTVALLGRPVCLTFHVVDHLAHDVVLGYLDLK
ncbi:hypothetical protein F4703DRAFT_1934940 [Phycomyces blakesleeanus]